VRKNKKLDDLVAGHWKLKVTRKFKPLFYTSADCITRPKSKKMCKLLDFFGYFILSKV